MRGLFAVSLVLTIINVDINTESFNIGLNQSQAGSCSDSTADACGHPDSNDTRQTENGGYDHGGGRAGGDTASGGNRGDGSSGGGNTGSNEDTNAEKVCGNGKTEKQIYEAYIQAIATVSELEKIGNRQIELDTVGLGITLTQLGASTWLRTIALGLFNGTNKLALGYIASNTRSRLRGEYRQALRSC